jgi:threonine dehydrogenase-like Zn-dependent dehydrogenase
MVKTVVAVKRGNVIAADPAKRGRVEVLDLPERELGPEDVKIRVAYCGICGVDPRMVEGQFDRTPPFGLGHEVSGTIVAVGPKATRRGLRVGDRVAGNFIKYCGSCYYCLNGQEQFCENGGFNCEPGMAEYVVWHECQVWKVPDEIPLEQACLLEPLSVVVRIADKSNMKVGQRVAIFGAGPIGLLAVQVMKMFGATALTLIEPVANRRALGESFGAEYVLDPSAVDVPERAKAITEGRGFDLVVEASGAPEAAVSSYEIAAPGATVLYISGYPEGYEMPVPLTVVFGPKELMFTGVFRSPYAFPRAIQLLPKMDLEPLTKNIFPLHQAEEAFAAHVRRTYPVILIKCND